MEYQLDPLIQKWFSETYGSPTDIQEVGWAKIARGENLFITAPTGSGKTLTAFLWGLNQIITGAWEKGGVKLLYISPLKALNNDIKENLLTPLEELKKYFETAKRPFPSVSVAVRSGDTPQSERQKVYRNPPDIFITTPESLNILVTSKQGRKLFYNFKTIILDEIHNVLGSKRGTHLITGVERLTLLAGEFQRIALSATVPDSERAARFVAGYYPLEEGEEIYRERPITSIASSIDKKIELAILSPENYEVDPETKTAWDSLTKEFYDIIERNRSTLIFTNSRTFAEKGARYVNDKAERQIVFAHHGSLSKELRHQVEKGLKKGTIQAVSATSSLELGIDIGTVDEVILLETPFAVSSALQRVGRAGHQVGEVSRGSLYPLYGRDFLEAASLMEPFNNKEIEPIPIPRGSLDLLSQIILGLALPEKWDLDKLYRFIRQASPYQDLSRKAFDAVINMLAGRYADSRIRELSPRIVLDKLENSIRTKEGMAWILYTNGGTIADRGYFELRVSGSNELMGELDEEFVWEMRIGDKFVFANRPWRTVNIDHKAVEATPEKGDIGGLPFWKSDDIYQPYERTQKTLLFLDEWQDKLEQEDIKEKLAHACFMNLKASERLIDFLTLQKEKTSLPGLNRIVLEHYQDPSNSEGSKQSILYTFWGGQVNGPLAYCFAEAWQQEYDYPIQVSYNNDGIALDLPHALSANDITKLLPSEKIESLLRRYLEKTPFFGAHFRENASRALLLPKSSLKKRMPLWLTRLRAKKLLQATLSYPDFPIIAETWRECFEEFFQLDILKLKLEELRLGSIEIAEAYTDQPSPLSKGLIFEYINKYMYEDDRAFDTEGGISLTEDSFLEEVLKENAVSLISKELNCELQLKLLRVTEGYLPSDRESEEFSYEFLELLKERVFLTSQEMALFFEKEIPPIPKMGIFERGGEKFYYALERKEEVELLLNEFDVENPEKVELFLTVFTEWLMGRAIVHKKLLDSLFSPIWQELLTEKNDSKTAIIKGFFLIEESEEQVVDRENFTRLLRLRRLKEASPLDPLSFFDITPFIATIQEVIPINDFETDKKEMEKLQTALEKLLYLPLPASSWEKFVLPSRVPNYRPEWLDRLLSEQELIWIGRKKERIAFGFSQEISLFFPSPTLSPEEKESVNLLKSFFVDPEGSYSLSLLQQRSSSSSSELLKQIWQSAFLGEVTSDRMGPLRQAISSKFKFNRFEEEIPPTKERSRHARSRFSHWKGNRPVGNNHGQWKLIPFEEPEKEGDLLRKQWESRERVYLLFERYGILFREVLEKEEPLYRWREIFSTLRVMELAGECLSGYFFKGIKGPQFISYPAYKKLKKHHKEKEESKKNRAYFINATDPASLAGLSVELLKPHLPHRKESNWVGFYNEKIVFKVYRNGKEVVFTLSEEESEVNSLFIKQLDTLLLNLSLKKLIIEKINDIEAHKSPYLPLFLEEGFSIESTQEGAIIKYKKVIGEF